jgi:hypothetical protein
VARSTYSYTLAEYTGSTLLVRPTHIPCAVTRKADHSCHSVDFYLVRVDFAPPFSSNEKNYIIFAHTAGHDYKSMGLDCSVKSERFSILVVLLG